MDLKSYLNQPGKSATALARTLGVSHSTVLRWADGKITPDEDRVASIITATSGVVTAADLRPGLAVLFASADHASAA